MSEVAKNQADEAVELGVSKTNTRNQYASPPEGNAIPTGHVQQRLALHLVSLRDS